MAANGAGSAVIGSFHIDRNFPAAETGYFTFYQFPLIGTMYSVTGLANPPFGRLIDMQKVQVAVTVAEAGQFRGSFVFKRPAVMTHETELELVFVVSGIKWFWITGLEQTENI